MVAADPEANIIFGTSVDDSMGGTIEITVIATGFPLQMFADESNGLPPLKKIYESFSDVSKSTSRTRGG